MEALPSIDWCSFNMQWEFKDKRKLNLYCKGWNNLRACWATSAKWAHMSASLCWSVQACKVCITNSAAGLMGQLRKGRLVYPAEWLISHLQQSLTSEHQSTQQWLWTCLAWAAEDLMATASSSNKLPLIGEEAVAGVTQKVLRRGSTPTGFKTEV